MGRGPGTCFGRPGAACGAELGDQLSVTKVNVADPEAVAAAEQRRHAGHADGLGDDHEEPPVKPVDEHADVQRGHQPGQHEQHPDRGDQSRERVR